MLTGMIYLNFEKNFQDLNIGNTAIDIIVCATIKKKLFQECFVKAEFQLIVNHKHKNINLHCDVPNLLHEAIKPEKHVTTSTSHQ